MIRTLSIFRYTFFIITFAMMWFILIIDLVLLMITFGTFDPEFTFKWTTWTKSVCRKILSKELQLILKS